jgi:hypothetical protein
MPEQKKILSDTLYQVAKSGVDWLFGISLIKASSHKNTLLAVIGSDGQNMQLRNNKKFGYGELNVTIKNALKDINYTIENKTGELYIHCEDSKNYHIDGNGNLIYTFR